MIKKSFVKKNVLALVLSVSMLAGTGTVSKAAPQKMADGSIFDAQFYASAYPDVAAAMGTNTNLLYSHYLKYGKKEGRLATAPGTALVNQAAPNQAAPGQAAQSQAALNQAQLAAQLQAMINAALAAQSQNAASQAQAAATAQAQAKLLEQLRAQAAANAAANQLQAPALAAQNTAGVAAQVSSLIQNIKNVPGYREGDPWTNESKNYRSQGVLNGNVYMNGYGCAAFGLDLSDRVFGNAPITQHMDRTKIKPGDVVRLDNDTHSVFVYGVSGSNITVAEGNFNNSVHYGRTINVADPSSGFSYVWTRY